MTFTFREVVALILLSLFAIAFAKNPHDATIVGALLTAFAAAWGFYLGGSKTGADTAAMNATTVRDNAKAAIGDPAPPPKDAVEAANQVAGAASDAADQITDNAKPTTEGA